MAVPVLTVWAVSAARVVLDSLVPRALLISMIVLAPRAHTEARVSTESRPILVNARLDTRVHNARRT